MPGTMKALLLLGLAVALLAGGCTGQGAAAVESDLSPAPVPTTTTTALAPFVELDRRAADLSAQSDLEAGLEAARAIYGSRGTFDAELAELNDFYPDQAFVALQEVASVEGVVYDAHGQRVTLYRQSQSGTWFCIDERATDETDYGLGDNFEAALADCTDGVTVVGWRNTFAANGVEESAAENLLLRFARSLEEGDVIGAHETFHPARACAVEELVSTWPDGRGLGSEAKLEILDIVVDGERAVATISLGDIPELAWDLEQYGEDWYQSADACEVLAPLAIAGQDAQARDLLLDGLQVLRTAFVQSSTFDHRPNVLAGIEPTIVFVPLADLDWALVGHGSHEAYGLVMTVGAPGHFFCAVESLGAVTGYGVGTDPGAINSQSKCSQTTTGLPDFPG